MRKFIRNFGILMVCVVLVQLGIYAFHAFIGYLLRTWDVEAAALAVFFSFWLFAMLLERSWHF
ncbi:hypothetical protein [Acaryochloris sp. CCMEE 5410]|uniref:hypothetical protein n=1 Tax=Acaryochloris sp. CCMEE 5410 TaxID=310037 RepID=UPI00024837C8|nr:hypothetical protein [Acaryochloris sp. CCMEE 5410]KAI9129603.1 hypothetical protein ON05_033440 [Acaryochloris sp. CCMEE 5410]